MKIKMYTFREELRFGFLTISSTVFEMRKHNRVVNAALLQVPGLPNYRKGFLFVKTTIHGSPSDIKLAFDAAKREAKR